ncbi:MAG: hypothetical protein MN733_08315 [Nitrososphaera sp.]|nr:hypothetical protein [Nitrososphaera sp.]
MSPMAADVARMFEQLHDSYLKNNEYDEGDLIFYRINYRIADAFGITKDEAERLHSIYHKEKPRRESEGYCERCGRVVAIIPIFYGIQSKDLPMMRRAESERRLIIGDVSLLRQDFPAAFFGCRECRNYLPKYGTI